jgi:hypothetical protein
MQEFFPCLAANGAVHATGSTGAPKRAGGLFAKGMPSHDLTLGEALPTTGPELVSTLTSAARAVAAAAIRSESFVIAHRNHR